MSGKHESSEAAADASSPCSTAKEHEQSSRAAALLKDDDYPDLSVARELAAMLLRTLQR